MYTLILPSIALLLVTLPAYFGFITVVWAGIFLTILSALIAFAFGVILAHHSAIIASNLKKSKLTKSFENRPFRFLVVTLWAIIAALAYNSGLLFAAGMVTVWVIISIFSLFYETILVGMGAEELFAQYKERKDDPPPAD